MQPQTMATLNAADYAALKALYQSTNGPNWLNRTGWSSWEFNSTTPPDVATVRGWHGVTVSDEGRVTKIYLRGNNLRGPIPAELSSLNQLDTLDLGHNQLSGPIPVELSNISQLRSLVLFVNQLSGSIPVELGNLTRLEWLVLGRNRLSGLIPDELGNLTQLKGLYLNHNQLSGTIPVKLGNLIQLKELLLSRNQLSGLIPDELGNLTQLEELHLNNNELSGAIPSGLGNLTQLHSLYLNDNQLSGAIAVELGNLPRLQVLFLSHNQLSGAIPVELGNLTQLRLLHLFVNQLSGPIPVELGNLAQLKDLYLNNNQLSGSIPVELGNLSQLMRLYLNRNQLSGPIPVELGNLTQLEELYLNNNQLSGSIPSSLSAFIANQKNDRNFNNLPIAPVSDQSLQSGETLNLALLVSDLDSGSDGDPNSISITVSSSNPTLIPDSAILLDGTGANRSLSITPAIGQAGETILTLSLSDGTGETATRSFKVTVQPPPNEVPVSLNRTVALNAGQTYAFTLADFPFGDSDGNDSLQHITLLSAPQSGSLKLRNQVLDSSVIGSGLAISRDDIAWLSFTPVPNTSGSSYASFSFSVSDGKASSQPQTLTLDVTPIIDAPIIPQGDNIQIGPPPAPLVSPLAGDFARPFSINFRTGRPGLRRIGTPRIDRFIGTNRNDSFSGRDRGDILRGRGGNDRLNGGSDNDSLLGGSGHDLLLGDGGHDRLSSGAGRDILVGGLGWDVLNGGTGQDSFLYSDLAFDTDVIMDFRVGEDQINLQPLLSSPLYSAASPQEKFARYIQLEQTSRGTLVKVDTDGSGAGTAMTNLTLLQGVQPSSLTASSFVV